MWERFHKTSVCQQKQQLFRCLLCRSWDVSISNSDVTLVSVWLQVEEVKKHNHCLAFSSAGPQSQTYYVSFDSFTEHLRWHRHAAKVCCECVSVWESSRRKEAHASLKLLRSQRLKGKHEERPFQDEVVSFLKDLVENEDLLGFTLFLGCNLNLVLTLCRWLFRILKNMQKKQFPICFWCFQHFLVAFF